jgi:hypothetical protein
MFNLKFGRAGKCHTRISYLTAFPSRSRTPWAGGCRRIQAGCKFVLRIINSLGINWRKIFRTMGDILWVEGDLKESHQDLIKEIMKGNFKAIFNKNVFSNIILSAALHSYL